MPANYRIAIVGAASLRGKELNEALGESPFAAAEFVLMDDQEAIGQLEAVGDEVTFIQQITAASFVQADFTFFTGSAELTRKHWETAVRAGSAVIDLSGALDTEKDAVVLAPWVQESVKPLNLQTPAAVPATPAALMLALLLGQVRQASAVRSAFATVLEPASEYGRGAMDELHQQTVSLLSFQSLPKALYDLQVAFNATPAAGPEGKIDSAGHRSARAAPLCAAGRGQAACGRHSARACAGLPWAYDVHRPRSGAGNDSGAVASTAGGERAHRSREPAMRTRHRIWWQPVRNRCWCACVPPKTRQRRQTASGCGPRRTI